MTGPLQIRDLPLSDRPRERLTQQGVHSLSQAELLSVVLRTGFKGTSAVELGHHLIHEFGSLEELSRASMDRLRQIKGIGHEKAATLKAAFELARRLTHETRRALPVMDTPSAIANTLRDEMSSLEVERFVVVLLNTRRRLIRVEEISRGLLDSVLVHAREVFRPAISANAHAVVLAHNHPGGDPTPSEADVRTTRDLIRAGQLLKIEVLDHVILGKKTEGQHKDYCSLRELGHFYS